MGGKAVWWASAGTVATLVAMALTGRCLAAQAPEICARPAVGSEVPEPEDLRSRDGVLKLQLSVRNQRAPDGSMRYCYVLGNGAQSPTLRLKPGDTLVLMLKNELEDLSEAAPGGGGPGGAHAHRRLAATGADAPCSGAAMSLTSTNLHFHGLTIPPLCHQDDVLRTSIQSGQAPFEYRFRIPLDEAPGLYWYHPHVHGFSSRQVLGGASGAMIIEGIERAEPQTAGLAERVLVIRDQDLLHPQSPPSRSEPVVPKMLIDRDGDAANNGTGFGKPAKDLSVNYVPVPYPDYPPASIIMRPQERQLWRVVNASAVTYLDLAVISARRPQPLGIVALDGVPLSAAPDPARSIEWREHIGLAPGSRAEFIVKGPPLGVPALLVTRTVDTGQGGENDPNRALASITARPDAAEPRSILPAQADPAAVPTRRWLKDVVPVRVRKLYFSEKLSNPADPNSATEFYLTLDGHTPKPYDPASSEPDIVVKQGDVEDWIIENRSTELHAFHIHQLHFLLLEWSGLPVDEPFLRDTVNVPYYRSTMLQYPSVRLRMDFRDPGIAGTFVYHCHLLEHEDAGMMGTLRVER